MQGRRNWLCVHAGGLMIDFLLLWLRLDRSGFDSSNSGNHCRDIRWRRVGTFLRFWWFWWFSSVSMKCDSACCEEFRFICRRGNISKLCIEVESKSVMWRLAVTISCANRSSRARRGFRDHLTLNVVLTSWVEGCKVECVRKPTLGGLHWCVIGG